MLDELCDSQIMLPLAKKKKARMDKMINPSDSQISILFEDEELTSNTFHKRAKSINPMVPNIEMMHKIRFARKFPDRASKKMLRMQSTL